MASTVTYQHPVTAQCTVIMVTELTNSSVRTSANNQQWTKSLAKHDWSTSILIKDLPRLRGS